ncbi:choice-of-anchor M domain-containing protein [Micromonospora aurantiaca (nom. illeg.)]|uniref:choice-of-anchor M domain-containing protein n=1 Tax=Micromonospora aurantiaca (nom. illeg.) TaxID=47850 RepID=UPI0009FC6C37|nr:choice-of-anchor M domain-containing protein [Micromonospora aurantiaca]
MTQCALATLIAVTMTQTPATAKEPTPGLSQSIAADQPLATDRAELSAGHVDLGPRYVDNQWTLLIHDGTQARPVWRNPDETVLRVSDAALQTVPDDPAYAFLGVDAGERVYVVPQVQNPDVVWLGWNTQDPRVMQSIDRGVTLTLLGVRGPGSLTTYLQSGTFAAPQPLWRSTEPKAQPFWAEVNTHTHANWVFTAPGVYLIAVQVSADLISGETVTATRTLRFAVGDATSTDEAYAATADIPVPAGQASPAGDRTGAAERTDGSDRPLMVGLTVAAALLAVGLVLLLLRGRGAKRRAERERAASPSKEKL